MKCSSAAQSQGLQMQGAAGAAVRRQNEELQVRVIPPGVEQQHVTQVRVQELLRALLSVHVWVEPHIPARLACSSIDAARLVHY